MKVNITRYETYHKEITIEVEIDADSVNDPNLLEKILEANSEAEEDFQNAFAEITHEEGLPSDEDRYDISHDVKGQTQIYGGHI